MTWDVVVIGGGALGTFHAYHLEKLGKKVLMLEKDLAPREATVRNFGQVVPSGFPIGRWHYYGRYSTQLYKELQAKVGIGIQSNGSLYIASDSSEMNVLEEIHQRFGDVDYSSTLFSKSDVLNYSDRFKSDYVVGGLYFPQEVSADPRQMIANVQRYLTESTSVEIRYRTTVIDITTNDKVATVVLAGGEKISANDVFLCNGRDFNVLFPSEFNAANIEVSKLQMMSTQPVDFNLKGNILTGLTIRRYESFKMCDSYKNLDPANSLPELTKEGIHILFKQSPDGSIIIGDSHSYADVSQGFDAGFDENVRINELIIEEANRILDLSGVKMRNYWSGFYAQMKGDEEIFEKTIDNRIHIVTGIGGKGMTASAGYAKENVERIYEKTLA